MEMMILNNETVINYIYNQVDKDSDYEDENGGNYDIFRSPDTPDAEGFILSPSEEFSDSDDNSITYSV